MKKLEKALNLAKAALLAVDAEIASRQRGVMGVGTQKQLEYIRSAFGEIVIQLETGKRVGGEFGISRMIVDSWPLSSSLGDLLIKAEKAYLDFSID